VNTQLELARLSAEATKLLQKSKSTLASANSEKILKIAAAIPEGLGSEATPRLVFCGQYSAGKSSLLRLLTGRDDIQVGAGITTDQVSTFGWKGVEVSDTPGIHTKLRPDHDDRSYAAIGRADVVVFVITNELMDSTVAKAFRRLAFDRQRADAMLLVVNKMGRAADGNTESAQQAALEGLGPVLSPRTPESLPVVFTDAEQGLRALKEENPDKRERRLRESNVAAFVEQLDQQAALAGATGKLRQPLFALESALNDGLGALGSNGSLESEAEKLLLERRRRIAQAQEEARRACRARVREAATSVRQQGNKAASAVQPGMSKEALEQQLAQADAEVRRISDELPGRIDRDLGPIFESLGADLKRMNENPLSQATLAQLKEIVSQGLSQLDVAPASLQKAKQGAGVAHEVGKWLVENSFNANVATFGGLLSFRSYSNSAMHDAVKAAGKVFGYKFAPWEAVRFTRGIAMAGRAIAVAGVVIGILSQMKEDVDARKAEDDERRAKTEISDAFAEAAQVIETHFDRESGSYVSSKLSLAQLDEQLDKIRLQRAANDSLYGQLTELLSETRALLNRVHAAQPGS